MATADRNSSSVRPTFRISDSPAFPTRRKFFVWMLSHLSAAKPGVVKRLKKTRHESAKPPSSRALGVGLYLCAFVSFCFIPYCPLRINKSATNVNSIDSTLIENNEVRVFTRIQAADAV